MILRNSILAPLSLGLLLTAGCVRPYVPAQPVQDDRVQREALTTPSFFNVKNEALPFEETWWAAFNDKNLTNLIETALAHNKQLDVAQANINVAMAGFSREGLERSYDVSSNAGLPTDRNARFGQTAATSFIGGLSAGWEWDAFGRIASAIEASELGIEAAEEARRDIAVIIASETALAYIDLKGAQARLQVAKDNADVQLQSLDLLQSLLENGRATELDVSRAEAQYRTTLATLPQFQTTIDAALSRLSVLTGRSASAPESELTDLKTGVSTLPDFDGNLRIGSPETLLRRRPDIRIAETEIARRLALSDVERARLFPTIGFDGNILAVFNNQNRIDRLSSFGFNVGPVLNWAGPDLRRVRADIDIADAQTQQAYAQYEQTVLQALADVEIALSNSANELDRRQDLIKAAEASRRALELARLRFEEGLDDFLDVLDAQRTVLENEDRLAQNRLQTTRLAVLTYRELGGVGEF